MSRCATRSVTRWSRAGRTICLLAILGLGRTALAQPSKPARPGPAPSQPTGSEPAPDLAPETQARLDEQAAALAEAKRALAAQQQQIDGMSAALADAQRVQVTLTTAQQALQAAIDAEHKARSDAELAARSTTPAVRSAWSYLTLSGLVQLDAGLRQSSQDELQQSGDPLNQDRFVLRRGRLRISADYGRVSGLAEMDLNTVNGSQVRVSTAEVAYRLAPWLTAEMGIPKIPFGFEVEQSDKERVFLERSTVVRALFPGEYDIGAKLSGGWRFLRYSLAVQNGEPVGEKGFALRDPNQDKDVTARLGVDTPIGRSHLAFGFSMLKGRGFHAGTPTTKDVLVWKDMNEDGLVSPGEVQVIQGQAGTPSASFDRFGLGADAVLTLDLAGVGTLTLYGELIVASDLDRSIVLPDPIATGRDFRELGYYAAVTYEPGAWAALGVRFDAYNPDADSAETRLDGLVPFDSSYSTLAITGALRHQHGRLILEYDHNTNHRGRATNGAPTNLADDALTLRAEIQL